VTVGFGAERQEPLHLKASQEQQDARNAPCLPCVKDPGHPGDPIGEYLKSRGGVVAVVAVVFQGSTDSGRLIGGVHRRHQVGKLLGKVGVGSESGRAAGCPRRLPSWRSGVRGLSLPGVGELSGSPPLRSKAGCSPIPCCGTEAPHGTEAFVGGVRFPRL
jgi:hypothetical protein